MHWGKHLLACLVLGRVSQFETTHIAHQLSVGRNRQTNGLVAKKMPRYMTDRQNGTTVWQQTVVPCFQGAKRYLLEGLFP